MESNMNNQIATQNNIAWTLDEEAAKKAGGGEYINEGGSYIGFFKEAKFITARTGSKGLELSFLSNSGMTANYLNIYFAKSNGDVIAGGANVVNALCAILGLKHLTWEKRGDEYHCPELTGKQIGIFLQKTLKINKEQKETCDLSIRVPFDPGTMRTFKEIDGSLDPKTISSLSDNYQDRDERALAASNQSNQNVGTTGGYDQSFS